jgi:5-methylcytosine-specific restriction protein A
MPSYRCKHPTCVKIIDHPGRCEAHQQSAPADNAERHRAYDRDRRNQDARAFYASAAWKVARLEKLAANPICEICQRNWSRDVHHKRPVRDFPDLRLEQSNLQALCPRCHKSLEARKQADRRRARPCT